jgi:hypothetical protein
MINKAIIRENYSKMHDGQLIAIAKEDGHDLTAEAFQVLKEEFRKRNLDHSYIESAEQTKISIHQEKIQKVKDSVADDFLKTIWKYVLDEKESGTPDNEILSGLQERGLDEPHSLLILSGVKDKLKELIDQSDTKMLVGGLSFIIGTFVTLVTYTSVMETGGYYYVAWGAIVFGAIRFFSGLSEKGKFKRLAENIEKNESLK